MVIDGLKNALEGQTDIRIIGIYKSANKLLLGIKDEAPDALLLDLQLPDKGGKELVPTLLALYPKLRILIFSGLESFPHVQYMMYQGCKGYLFKSTADQATLLEAIRCIQQGKTFLDVAIKEQLLEEMRYAKRKELQKTPTLTRREKEILKLIASACNDQQIADSLLISLQTVEANRYNLMQKLGLKNKTCLERDALLYCE